MTTSPGRSAVSKLDDKRPRRRVYLDRPLCEGESVALDDSARKRLVSSLRLSSGAEATAFNGKVEHRCTLDITGGRAVLKVGPQLTSMAESPLNLVLIQGWSKGGRIDLAIEKGTELGVARFVVFEARRSVPRQRPGPAFEEGSPARLGRWRRLAVCAAEQCGRLRPPEISLSSNLEHALDVVGGFDVGVALDPGGGGRGLGEILRTVEAVRSAAALVGPEGGLEDSELALAESRGFERAAAGPRILRTETAGVAACALLQYALGDLGRSIRPTEK